MFTTKNLFTLAGKHLLIAFGSIVFAAVIILFLSQQINKISARSAKDRQLATMLSERTEILSNLKHDTDIIGSNDVIIRQTFIPSNNILEFVAVLENLAIKNKITQVFHFSSPTTVETGSQFPMTTINYQNNITANITTFIDYLREFEQLPYFTKIDSINISAGEEGWLGRSTISFNATILAHSAQ